MPVSYTHLLLADDLAHVLGRDMHLKDRGLGSDSLLNGHGVLVLHQRPCLLYTSRSV